MANPTDPLDAIRRKGAQYAGTARPMNVPAPALTPAQKGATTRSANAAKAFTTAPRLPGAAPVGSSAPPPIGAKPGRNALMDLGRSPAYEREVAGRMGELREQRAARAPSAAASPSTAAVPPSSPGAGAPKTPGRFSSVDYKGVSSASQATIDKMPAWRQHLNGRYVPPPVQNEGTGILRRGMNAVTGSVKGAVSAVKGAAGAVADGTVAGKVKTAFGAKPVVPPVAAGAPPVTPPPPAAVASPAAQGPKASITRRVAGAAGRTAVGAAKGTLVGGAKLAARVAPIITPLTAVYSAGQSMGTDTSEYRERLGMGEQGSVAGDAAARTAGVTEDFGNNLTGGYAGRLGAGLGIMAAGGNFSDGWNGGAEKAAPVEAPPLNWIDPPKSGETSSGPRVPSAMNAVDDNATAAAKQMYTDAQARSDAGTGPLVMAGGTSAASRNGGFYDKASPGTVIGQFNGRDITKAESEARGAMLPTSNGPVIGGEGVNAVAFNPGRDRGPVRRGEDGRVTQGFDPAFRGVPGVPTGDRVSPQRVDMANGYGGNTAQTGGMDAASYGSSAAETAPMARRETPQGYSRQGYSTSRGNTADDKRVMEMDLRSVGRGSPSMRRAIMERYLDRANNSERGQNDMATTDLSAAARGADGNADRSQQGDQFDETMAQNASEFAAEREDKMFDRQALMEAAGYKANADVQEGLAKDRRAQEAANSKQYNTYLAQFNEDGLPNPIERAQARMYQDRVSSGATSPSQFADSGKQAVRNQLASGLLDARSGSGVRAGLRGQLPNYMNDDGAPDASTLNVAGLTTSGAKGPVGWLGNVLGGDNYSISDGTTSTTVDPTEMQMSREQLDMLIRQERTNLDKAAQGR